MRTFDAGPRPGGAEQKKTGRTGGDRRKPWTFRDSDGKTRQVGPNYKKAPGGVTPPDALCG